VTENNFQTKYVTKFRLKESKLLQFVAQTRKIHRLAFYNKSRRKAIWPSRLV